MCLSWLQPLHVHHPSSHKSISMYSHPSGPACYAQLPAYDMVAWLQFWGFGRVSFPTTPASVHSSPPAGGSPHDLHHVSATLELLALEKAGPRSLEWSGGVRKGGSGEFMTRVYGTWYSCMWRTAGVVWGGGGEFRRGAGSPSTLRHVIMYVRPLVMATVYMSSIGRHTWSVHQQEP
jgi:hypothetical protein